MKRKAITVCHDLRLIPVDELGMFARIGSNVVMVSTGIEISSDAIPGSIKISNSADSGVVKKKISYEVAEVSPLMANKLELLKHSRLVATYVDESENRRVSGSPDYPLQLDYMETEGVYTVTLTGEDTVADGFVAE